MRRTVIDAQKLDEAMRGKFQSRRQLAFAANVSQLTIANVCKGLPWTSATLDALANALDVPSLSLLSEVETVDIPLRAPAPQAMVAPMAV